jgi:hypothetical protein
MADFSKIVDHPENREIISKLIKGEDPKFVSKYLKDKYTKPDEAHLRIPATTLQEFLDSYADHHGYVKKIIQRNNDTKLDKKIADSLLDNNPWKERIIKGIDKEVKYIDKLDNVLTILETRAEQIFDMIQSDPENTRTDYVFTKYLELLMIAIEKADKIRNDKPDIRIEHTYTIQMVEQQSLAIQEAIRKVLDRLGPDKASLFMDMLNEELSKINPKNIEGVIVSTPKQIEAEIKEINNLDNKISEFDQKFLEDGNDNVE